MAGRAPRVVIIGAGIGGLAAAAALLARGIEVELHERAAALGEVGAGLQLGPNAVKVLRALGLEEGLLRIAGRPTSWTSLRWNDGGFRFREPLLGEAPERFGAPYLTAHRADLHALLLSRVPGGRVRLGAACTGVETRGGAAVARFADGSEAEGDVVVGADGIRSVVREGLFGADRPRFTGQVCWRAMVPVEAVPRRVGPPGAEAEIDPQDYTGWIGPTGHVICYPIRAGRTYNIFAGHVAPGAWAEEGWAVPSTLDELLAAHAGWAEPLLAMFRAAGPLFKWGIHDREPLAGWTRGRVTLLGDAAHPMMPTLAQGAAISMEDGAALARILDRFRDDPAAGLAAYSAERAPRAGRVQLQARRQFDNNRQVPPPPPLDRGWIFEHDATAWPPAGGAVASAA